MSKARELSQRAGVDGALSNRNKVINGSFLVWQRSDNAYNGGGGAYVSADRFMATRGRIRKPNTNGHSGEDNTGAVFDCTDGNVYVHFDYFIEDIGQKLNGKTMTLSFKMKSLTGVTESLYYEQSGVDYFDIGGNTTLTVPTEWTTFKFTGTVVSTGHVGGIHLPRWYLNPTGNASSKRLQIDEVQFEEGDTATPFEHRSFGQELSLCQRFYQKTFRYDVQPAVGNTSYYVPANAWAYASNDAWVAGNTSFITPMRTSPSLTVYSQQSGATTGQIGVFNGSNWFNATASTHGISDNAFLLAFNPLATGSKLVAFNYTADAELYG